MQTPIPAVAASVIVSASVWAMWMSALNGDAFSTSSVTPAPSAFSLTGREQVGEAVGRLLPGQRPAPAGQEVDACRTEGYGDVDGVVQLLRRPSVVTLEVGVHGKRVVHMCHPGSAAGQCPLRLFNSTRPHQQRGDERQVLHAECPAVFDECRRALGEERDLMHADAGMHA